MSEEKRNADDRLESMLRQWGADEAARSVTVASAPTVEPFKHAGPPWSVGRRIAWAAAAAVILCVVATSFYFLGVSSFRPARPDDALGEGSPAYAKLKAQYAAATQAGADANRAIVTMAQNDRATIDGLKSQVAAKELALGNAQARARDAGAAMDKAKADIAEAVGRYKETQDKLTTASVRSDKTDKDLADARQKLALATKELAGITQMHQDALAAVQKAQAELAAMAPQTQAMFQDIQNAVLTGSLAADARYGPAPQLTNDNRLRARQLAAARARLIQRAQAARAEASNPVTARLIDRLEVVLTRLELLDADNSESSRMLAGMLVDSHLLTELDNTLKISGQEPAVRAWLTEAKLVLWGADHVA